MLFGPAWQTLKTLRLGLVVRVGGRIEVGMGFKRDLGGELDCPLVLVSVRLTSHLGFGFGVSQDFLCFGLNFHFHFLGGGVGAGDRYVTGNGGGVGAGDRYTTGNGGAAGSGDRYTAGNGGRYNTGNGGAVGGDRTGTGAASGFGIEASGQYRPDNEGTYTSTYTHTETGFPGAIPYTPG